MNNRLATMLEVRKGAAGIRGAQALPQSKDAEMGVLGSILLAPSRVMDECVERAITQRHFHHPAHAVIFETCRDMVDRQKPVDLISLTQRLEDLKLLPEVGGAAAVTELFTFVP